MPQRPDPPPTGNPRASARASRTYLGDQPTIKDQLGDPIGAEDHVFGRPHAPLTLVEYGDYECTYCRQAGDQVNRLLSELAGGARFAFRHFPVALVHPHAHRAAEAAEAAAQQGRFWDMHHRLLATHRVLDLRKLLALARELGLDEDRFQSDLGSHEHLARVRRDIESGMRSGVTRTPTFFVNGQRFERAYDAETVDGLIAAVRAACTGRVP